MGTNGTQVFVGEVPQDQYQNAMNMMTAQTPQYNQIMESTYGMPRPDFAYVYGQPNPNDSNPEPVGTAYWRGINKDKDDAVNAKQNPNGWITRTLLKRIRNINAGYSMQLTDCLNVCSVLKIQDVGQYDQDLKDALIVGFINVVTWINGTYSNADTSKELCFLASMCGFEDYCKACNCLASGGSLGYRTDETPSGGVRFILHFSDNGRLDGRY